MRVFDEKLLSKTLDYITLFQKENGRSPSYRNIMNKFKADYNNLTKVQRYLKALRNRGLIQKDEDNGKIAIDSKFLVSKTRAVPLVGNVACGAPITAIENIEANYELPEELVGKGESFLLKADGESMIEEGIYDGDILIVKRQSCADPGQIVIALIDDEATAKIYLPQKDHIILRPANKNMEDIIVKECNILGVVKSNIHRFG